MTANHEKILMILAEKRMQKGELARRMKCKNSRITNILSRIRDHKNIEPSTIGDLARALGVPVTAIVDLEKEVVA